MTFFLRVVLPALLLLCVPVMCLAVADSPDDDIAAQPDQNAVYQLDIYWEWDMNPESGIDPQVIFSEEGIVERGYREDPERAEADGLIIEEIDTPGGLTFSFRGVSPGEVVLTMRNVQNETEILNESVFTLLVLEDLRIVVVERMDGVTE